MAARNKRFTVVQKEGSTFGTQFQVIVDRQTGVNYLFCASGYAGGLTPLLDRGGTPVVSGIPAAPELEYNR